MKILLPIDNSEFSDAATETVISQFAPRKTAVRVLHAVEPIEAAYYPELTPPYPADFSDINKRRMADGRKLTERAAAKFRAARFRVETIVNQKHARTAIVDTATKWRADLIVMGSHGRTGLGRLLLGSVSEYVVRHAPCSVQIVRAKTTKRSKKAA